MLELNLNIHQVRAVKRWAEECIRDGQEVQVQLQQMVWLCEDWLALMDALCPPADSVG
jgi:hypothetical protein